MSNEYYHPNKLLTMKDLDGETPEIFLCCGNRTAGKTYSFKRMLINRFINKGEKFIWITRRVNELGTASESFFKDLEANDKNLQGRIMTEKRCGSMPFSILSLDDEPCGYVLPLYAADSIKRNSSLFIDAQSMLFDEIQPESNRFLKDELVLFQSVHTSVARGKGYYRPVPVYLLSNAVTVLNPYFVQFGIHKRINSKTRFMRGHGWVLEMVYNENAANAQKTSGFARAFGTSTYNAMSQNNTFLLDDNNFIERNPQGKMKHYCTLLAEGKKYGVWQNLDNGLIYVSEKYDQNYPIVIAFKVQDHSTGSLFEDSFIGYSKALKQAFEAGLIRCTSLECKKVLLDFVGLSVV